MKVEDMARKYRTSPFDSPSLENDARNPCFGCGPTNPRGLRLTFHRSDAGVVSRLEADETMVGWPGRLHSGVLYTAMLETANWTIFAVEGRVGLPIRTGALKLRRWIETGEVVTLRGRSGPIRDRRRRVLVESRDARRRIVATIDRSFLMPTRREFLLRMGYDRLPEVLEDLVPRS